jgi:hypothetical protein
VEILRPKNVQLWCGFRVARLGGWRDWVAKTLIGLKSKSAACPPAPYHLHIL